MSASRAMARPPGLRELVPLAPLTTLELGGPARFFLEARTRRTLVSALRWAAEKGLPVALLGGGSNLVVADSGFPGLVVRVLLRGLETRQAGGGVSLCVAAGEPWDRVAEWAVEESLAGVECLSGIPGTAGAVPIQNVGAYGQEVAEVVETVRALDRATLQEVDLAAEECGFGYRTSRFRVEPERFAILAVTLRLEPGGEPALRYPELAAAVGSGVPGRPSLAAVRAVVLDLRRTKSMLVDSDDPNRRSVGSFFVNPVVGADQADEVVRRALDAGVVERPEQVPRFAVGEGRVKLSAAWLVERAGLARGYRRGSVGISSRHSLALVHHGGGRTADLLALASQVHAAVETKWGVCLAPEPVFLGFPSADPLK